MLFFRVHSCEHVGLRREKSFFALHLSVRNLLFLVFQFGMFRECYLIGTGRNTSLDGASHWCKMAIPLLESRFSALHNPIF